MSRSEPLIAALRRQATYALTAFVCAALALEVIIPGSVLPFLDIVPLAFIAAGLLFYDAARRQRTRRFAWVRMSIALLFAAVVLVSVLLLGSWDGRAGAAAAVVLSVGIASLAFWPRQ